MEAVNWVQRIYTLRLPHYMVFASIRISTSSIRATTDIMDTGSGYYIIRRSELSICSPRHACADYKISTVGDANKNLVQILSAVISRIQLGSAVHKTIFSVAHYFSVEVLICNRFMNRHLISRRCTDREVEFTKRKILLLGGAQNDHTVKGLQSMEDDYSVPTMSTQTTRWTSIQTSCVIRLLCVNTSH